MAPAAWNVLAGQAFNRVIWGTREPNLNSDDPPKAQRKKPYRAKPKPTSITPAKALSDSERRFRLLVDAVVDYAIYMLDPEGIITNWSTGAERIEGYAAAEAIGQHFSIFYTPEDREAGVPGDSIETARRESNFAAEGWQVRKDGTRF